MAAVLACHPVEGIPGRAQHPDGQVGIFRLGQPGEQPGKESGSGVGVRLGHRGKLHREQAAEGRIEVHLPEEDLLPVEGLIVLGRCQRKDRIVRLGGFNEGPAREVKASAAAHHLGEQ